MQAQLKVAKGSSSGKLFRIDGQQFIIGRATGCHLRPQSDAISRQHCAFIVKDGRLYVKDLGSRNGTVLNGEKLSSASEVQNGDHVQVGPLHLEVVITQSETPTQASTETVASPKKATAPAAQKDEGGFIDWLMEEDAKEQDGESSSREFNLDTAVTTTVIRTDEEEDEEQKKEEKKKKKKKKEFGKLPAKGQDLNATENSRDAAADTLRQLYNRGT